MAETPINPKTSDQGLPADSRKVTQPLAPPGRGAVGGTPTIPGYTNIRKIERGGQSRVYEAEQISTGQKFAVKVLSSVDPADEGLLRKEIDTLVSLDDDFVVRLFDSGRTAEGQLYLVMELVRGPELTKFVAQKNLRQVVEVFHKIALGLGAVHELGVVHRDIKPSNILIDAKDCPKIIDFGFVKPMVRPDESLDEAGAGTLFYMSPEQTEGIPGKIGKPSDVYSLGVTFYWLLAGRPPYVLNGSRREIIDRIQQWEPTKLREAWSPINGVHGTARSEKCPIDGRLERVIHRMLAKDSGDRYKNGDEVAKDFENLLNDRPLNPPLRGLIDDGLLLRYRQFAQRHVITHALALIILASTIAGLLFVPIIYSPLLGIDGWYERRLFALNTWLHPDAEVDVVTLIARTDQTDWEALAKQGGIERVSNQDPPTWRPIHEQLLRKLKDSGCKVIVLDMYFTVDAPGDQQLSSAIVELSELSPPIPVVAATKEWRFGGKVPEAYSHLLQKVLILGLPLVGLNSASGAPELHLASKRDPLAPLPSMVINAVASFRNPGVPFALEFDEAKNKVEVVFENGRAESYVVSGFTLFDETHKEEVAKGLYNIGDRCALCTIPTNSLSTDIPKVPYEWVLGASWEELQKSFSGRIALVGDMTRDSQDKHIYNEKEYYGCAINAMGINALLSGHCAVRLSWLGERIVAVLGAVIGLLAAKCFPATKKRALALLAGTALCVLVSLIFFMNDRMTFNPLFPAAIMLVASELSHWLRKIRANELDPV